MTSTRTITRRRRDTLTVLDAALASEAPALQLYELAPCDDDPGCVLMAESMAVAIESVIQRRKELGSKAKRIQIRAVAMTPAPPEDCR